MERTHELIALFSAHVRIFPNLFVLVWIWGSGLGSIVPGNNAREGADVGGLGPFIEHRVAYF